MALSSFRNPSSLQISTGCGTLSRPSQEILLQHDFYAVRNIFLWWLCRQREPFRQYGILLGVLQTSKKYVSLESLDFQQIAKLELAITRISLTNSRLFIQKEHKIFCLIYKIKTCENILQLHPHIQVSFLPSLLSPPRHSCPISLSRTPQQRPLLCFHPPLLL